MKNSIYPSLWFDQNAKEAAELYCAVFPNSSIKMENPIVVTFEINGKLFMGINGGPVFKPNPSISFFMMLDSKGAVNAAWERLTENGQVMMPLDTYPWSEYYGWVQDRFGVSWQLSVLQPGNITSEVFPSLMFTGDQNGKAEEAINFYTSLFKNSSIELVAKYEAGEQDTEGNVKYAQFYLDGVKMSAMDSSYAHKFGFNEGVSLVISCETQEEIDYYWLNLTEGGKESNCGWCQDTYGVWWQVVPARLGELMSDPVKAPKVTEAFMQMKKFDIETLEKAAV